MVHGQQLNNGHRRTPPHEVLTLTPNYVPVEEFSTATRNAPYAMTNTTMTSEYHLGRSLGELEPPYSGTDKTFAAQRLDDKVIGSPKYKHCTFVNVSFKEANLVDGNFLDCIFVGCYFRRAQFTNCHFVGCRFFDCNFNHLSLKSCDFRYSTFRGCQVAHSEMEYNLPSEPNLKEELARNLSVESSRLRLAKEAKRYRISEIVAHEEHLKAAMFSKSKWYRTHFNGVERISAFLEWGLSLLNRWLWGYGERAMVLIRNFMILSFLIFPALFYVFKYQLSHASEKPASFIDLLYFSLENITPAAIGSGIVATGSVTRLLAGVESLFGVVTLALLAAYIFRWSLHR